MGPGLEEAVGAKGESSGEGRRDGERRQPGL